MVYLSSKILLINNLKSVKSVLTMCASFVKLFHILVKSAKPIVEVGSIKNYNDFDSENDCIKAYKAKVKVLPAIVWSN